MTHPITQQVAQFRQKKWEYFPSIEDLLIWIGIELSEASELNLARKPYRRNHPKESYSPERFAEELGDVIFAALVAGLSENVDPLQAMLDKMEKQL